MKTLPIKKIYLSRLVLKIGVTLSFICVIYYTYLPFLYIINISPIEKNILFVSIVAMSLCIGVFYFFLCGGRIYKNLTFTIGLYAIFSMYALISFKLHPNYLDDFFTIRTITIINSTFIVLAFLCRNEKKYLLTLLYLASIGYFLFTIYGFLTGRLALSGNVFQDIFGLTEKVPYQNINVYLGIFVILSVVTAKYAKMFLKKCLLYLLSLSAVGFMLVIGGRTSLCAVMVVVIIFYIAEYTMHASLDACIKTFFSLFIIAFVIVAFHSHIIKLLTDTVTGWRILILFEGGDYSMRLSLFSSAIALFLSNVKTFIFGAGINSFPVYIGENSVGMYPHNIILELLSEYGILGTFLFLSPVAYILLIRKSRLGTIYGRSVIEKLIFLLASYFWTMAMATGGLRNSWVLIFFTFLLIPTALKARSKYTCNNSQIDYARDRRCDCKTAIKTA